MMVQPTASYSGCGVERTVGVFKSVVVIPRHVLVTDTSLSLLVKKFCVRLGVVDVLPAQLTPVISRSPSWGDDGPQMWRNVVLVGRHSRAGPRMAMWGQCGRRRNGLPRGIL